MIAFPPGFDVDQVFIDLISIATPIFQLLFIGFIVVVIISALRKGGKGVE
ncbi:MAG: hypothetical protein NDI73_00020 [Desulfuromonadales bacterium]|nr:hypothetical protein [Desulfuromonadales bacterium]